MRYFTVLDSSGDSWGFVSASNADEAVAWVVGDIDSNPDSYMGSAVGLHAVEAL